MADSDGPPPDANDSGPVLPPVARPVAPAPRVNPPNVNTPKDATPPGAPPGFTDFMEWMRVQFAGGTAPGQTAPREILPKEKKKFQRRETEVKGDAPAAPAVTPPTPESKPAPAPEAKPLSPPAPVPAGGENATASADQPSPASVEPLSPRVRRQQQGAAKRNSWLGLLTQLGMLILLAGSFLVGRLSVSKVAPAAPAAPAAPEVINSDGKATTKVLSEENARLIDQAMAAEQNFHFKEAEELLGKVKASGEHVPGLSFQLGQLATFEGDYNKALPLLNDAIALGEDVAEAYNLRATLGSRSGLIRGNGLNDYDTATKVDPFGSRVFYYWGAALRRAGKDQAAVVRLQQAIDRLREPELESLYRLTLRLTKIEIGQENEFADELATQLALPNPGMDWLITAAAEEIHNGKFAAAAAYLDRASQRGDPETFELRLRDFYLSQFRFEKELARFYPKSPAVRPGDTPKPAESGASPAPDIAAPPAIGLEVPPMPPPASPGVLLPH